MNFAPESRVRPRVSAEQLDHSGVLTQESRDNLKRLWESAEEGTALDLAERKYQQLVRENEPRLEEKRCSSHCQTAKGILVPPMPKNQNSLVVRWHAPLPTAASWTQLRAPAPALRGVDVLLIIARHHQATTPVPALIAQVVRSSFVLEALARQLIQRM